LGAVVIVAIIGMIKVKAIRRLYSLNRTDFTLAIVALLGVLTFDALEGLLIAVILSLLALVWRASQSRLSVLGREPGRILFSDSRRHPENHILPGLLILRPDEGLFFANADTLRNDILGLVDDAQDPVKVVLLDLEMSSELDVPSVDMLGELKLELGKRNAELWLSRLHGPVRDALDRSGVLEQVGPQNIYPRALESSLEYISRGSFDGGEDLAVVNDGLKMTLEVIEKLLADPTIQRRAVLESHQRKLTEILETTKTQPIS